MNGRECDLAPDATVADAIRATGADPAEPGIAAAIGDDIVSRSSWSSTPLPEGATVEVVRAAAGG